MVAAPSIVSAAFGSIVMIPVPLLRTENSKPSASVAGASERQGPGAGAVDQLAAIGRDDGVIGRLGEHVVPTCRKARNRSFLSP